MTDAGANTGGTEIPDMSEMRRSSRDPEELRDALTHWLGDTLGADGRERLARAEL